MSQRLTVWDQERAGKAEHWRVEPVDVLVFAREFLHRDHSEPQEEALYAIFGDNPRAFWPTMYDLYGLCWGMGSGKNMTMETAAVYTDYLTMCLRHPQQFFWGRPERRFIDILNLSFVKEDQAKEIFFDSMKSVMRAAINPATGNNWFEEQGVDLRDNGIGDIKQKIILLPNGIRNRCIVATREGFEGSNILMAFFDEPSRAVTSPAKNAVAHNLVTKVRANTRTRFGDMGKVVIFSYPEAEEDDLMMETVAAAEKGEPGVWATKAATYDVNPLRSYEDFEEFRRTEPDLYSTIIECEPPASRTGFYRAHMDKVDACFKPSLKPVVEWELFVNEREIREPDGSRTIKKFTAIRLISARDDAKPRALGGDPGAIGDSFCLAMGKGIKTERAFDLLVERQEAQTVREQVTGQKLKTVQDGEVIDVVEERVREERIERKTINQMPVVDLIIVIDPIKVRQRGKATVVYPVDFVSIKDFMLELKTHFVNLRIAQFDQWNSMSLIQELMNIGIKAVDLPFSNRQQLALYRQHRQLVFNEYIQCVECERARLELRALQDLGHKVDHKEGGSKDAADAIVCCVDGVLQLETKPQSKVFF